MPSRSWNELSVTSHANRWFSYTSSDFPVTTSTRKMSKNCFSRSLWLNSISRGKRWLTSCTHARTPRGGVSVTIVPSWMSTLDARQFSSPSRSSKKTTCRFVYAHWKKDPIGRSVTRVTGLAARRSSIGATQRLRTPATGAMYATQAPSNES